MENKFTNLKKRLEVFEGELKSFGDHVAALEKGYESTLTQIQKDNSIVEGEIKNLKALLDCFTVVMTERPETLTYDSEDPFYQYLKEALDSSDNHEMKSNAERRLIFKTRLESGLQRFLRDVI